MVAIKIQSREDIIAAYLQNFGFNPAQLPEKVQSLTAHPALNSDNGDELVRRLDQLLLEAAHRTFPESALDTPQLLAQFKLCFLLCNGASQCSVDAVQGFSLSPKLADQMQQCYICNAPSYHYTAMKPQTIESFASRQRKKK